MNVRAALTDPAPHSALAAALVWVKGAALGDVAAAVGVIAIAGFGLLMLRGRIEFRRGLAVVIGCFLIFGARAIGPAFVVEGGASVAAGPPDRAAALEKASRAAPPSSSDPYAGASLRRDR